MKFKKKLIAGVVIIYIKNNCELEEILKNIYSYARALDKLYVWDNSESNHENKVKEIIPTCEYINDGINHGISKALNEILEKVKGDYLWLLTMDQDSRFFDDDINRYIGYLNNQSDKVYALTPRVDLLTKKERGYIDNNLIEEVDSCITSGQIVNIEWANKVGGWDEKLFIDEVDFEFCIRCRENGGILLRINDIMLEHSLGDEYVGNFCGYKREMVLHSSLREYYIIRNILYVANKFKCVRKFEYIKALKVVAKSILFEENKISRARYLALGVRDYLCNRMGRYVD